MDSLILSSATVGIVISLLAYEIGLAAQRKWKLAILNPLLISIILVIGFLVLFHVDYDSYNNSAQYLSYLLTPATVCLAIPLYLQLDLLKKNIGAILEKAGTEYASVLKTTCFLSDMNDFAAFNEVYAKYFTEKPARSCVAVKTLPKNVLCEVEVIAVVE